MLKIGHIVSVNFNLISDETILKTVNALKNDYAPGRDNIITEVIKNNSTALSKPLNYIFYTSIANEVFPDLFKTVVITSVFEKEDTQSVENYCPISLISNIAKIFGKVLKLELQEYLEANDLLSSSQYGFRSNRGTDQAIANALDAIYSALDDYRKCVTIYLDLAKAFDTVDYDILS